MQMPMSTSPFYDTTLYEPVNIINGISIHSVSLLRGFALNFTSAFGGKQSILQKKFIDARNECLKDLTKNSNKIEGAMIVDIKINTEYFDDFIIFTATGTVLKNKKINKINKNNKK